MCGNVSTRSLYCSRVRKSTIKGRKKIKKMCCISTKENIDCTQCFTLSNFWPFITCFFAHPTESGSGKAKGNLSK